MVKTPMFVGFFGITQQHNTQFWSTSSLSCGFFGKFGWMKFSCIRATFTLFHFYGLLVSPMKRNQETAGAESALMRLYIVNSSMLVYT